MATEREEMFEELPEGAFLYCIKCERAYPKDKFRKAVDTQFWVEMQMCPYEDCTADAVLDSWEWDTIYLQNDDYPEIPEEGKVYPMYGNKK